MSYLPNEEKIMVLKWRNWKLYTYDMNILIQLILWSKTGRFFIGGGAVTKRVRYVDEIRQSENGDFIENNSTPGKQ